MLLTCPSCETSYQVDSSSLGRTGRAVRCIRCSHVWFAANSEALAAIAQAHRAAIEELAAASLDAEAPVGAADEPRPDAPDYREEDARPLADDLWAEPGGTATPDLAATEPVTIADAPTLAPAAGSDLPAIESSAAAGDDIETVAARRTKARERRGHAWSLPGSMTTILALVAINLALLAWRQEIVRWLPQTASLYAAVGLPVNLRGLAFADVATTTETHEGTQVLIVEGTIANVAPGATEVPRLRFSVRNERGHEVYTWTAQPAKPLLAPGETLPFRSRLAAPPRDSHQVLVRFFNRRDLASGIE